MGEQTPPLMVQMEYHDCGGSAGVDTAGFLDVVGVDPEVVVGKKFKAEFDSACLRE